MNRYLKLVNFEFNRFSKIYISLIVLTIVSQIIGVFVVSNNFLKNAKEIMGNSSVTVAKFIEENEAMSFYQISGSLWVIGPIVICIAALLFYMFLIWYRDWYGKNSFIYRLLMIPTARLNIYFAKATSLFLMVLGLVAVQISLLPLENIFMKYLVPSELRIDLTLTEIINSSQYIALLFPTTLFDFGVNYAIGFIFVFVIFTAILLERSFGVIGILLAAFYGVATYLVLLLPLFITATLDKAFLYPMEYFILEVVLVLIILGISIMISRFLLNKKITV